MLIINTHYKTPFATFSMNSTKNAQAHIKHAKKRPHSTSEGLRREGVMEYQYFMARRSTPPLSPQRADEVPESSPAKLMIEKVQLKEDLGNQLSKYVISVARLKRLCYLCCNVV